MGKAIYYMEINDGEMLSVSDEKMAEMKRSLEIPALILSTNPEIPMTVRTPHRTQIMNLWAGQNRQQTFSMSLRHPSHVFENLIIS